MLNHQTVNTKELLIKSANSGIELQNKDGSFPKGINGPWNHIDTPVRNTAHWAYLLYSVYLITGDKKFYNSAINACNFLINPKNRPYGIIFYCRELITDNKNKIRSNGLIGQCWAIEPLILIGKYEKNQEYLEISRNVILAHPFNKNKFSNVDIDNKIYNTNTLNQQIWFAYIILYLGINEYIPQINLILENLITIDDNGCANHLIKSTGKKELSIGYHSFILTGLARIYNLYPNFNFFSSEKFKKMLKYPLNNKINSPYAWQYNPTGIELYYTWKTFNISNDDSILKQQIENHFNFKENLMNKNTVDKHTLSARIYELCYLLEGNDHV